MKRAPSVRVEKHFGVVRMVDVAPIRSHIAALMGYGLSMQSIAGSAGVHPSTIRQIRGSREQRTVREYIAKAILAVPIGIPTETYRSKATQPHVPKMGAVRRLQALMAIGWQHRELKARCGFDTQIIIHRSGARITLDTHQTIARVYEQLCMTPGPSPTAITWARKLGYAPPMAWDDIDTDPIPMGFDAGETPDSIRPQYRNIRHGTERGYQRHCIDKTEKCEPCREAHRLFRQMERAA